MSEFLGSRISLISKSDIRYVGVLHQINSDESTVSLENVRSFGTEGRRGRPEDEIAPSDQVYEYIIFRGSDVKDLRIEEHPSIKENNPPVMPDDPAIVGASRTHPGPQGSGHNGPPPPGAAPFPGPPPPPGPWPPAFYGPPGSWGRGGPGGPGPGPGPAGFGHMPYPPPSGWFPGQPAQGFPAGPPGGPAPWNNQGFPPGPGAPSGPDVHAQRGAAGGPGPQQPQAPVEVPASESAKPSSKPPPATQPTAPSKPTRQPSNAPTPPVASKPSAEAVKATAASLGSDSSAKAPMAVNPAPAKTNRVNPVIPLSGSFAKPFQPKIVQKEATQTTAQATVTTTQATVQDATSAARAAVALAMAQLGNSGTGNAMDNLTNKVNEMRVNATRGGPVSRGRGRGGRPAQGKVEVPDSDFDFAQANAKFNKVELVKEVVGSPQTETATGNDGAFEEASVTPDAVAAYSKTRSFFDNISSEAKDRAENGQKAGGREWRDEEQRRNMETFGQSSVDGGHRGYRGRGRGRGRGGRGRGSFNRGGQGFNASQ